MKYKEQNMEKAKEAVEDVNKNRKTIPKQTAVVNDWKKRLEKDGIRFDLLYQGTGEFVSDDEGESPFID